MTEPTATPTKTSASHRSMRAARILRGRRARDRRGRTRAQVYGAPVYVRHEIVHNKYVVDSLKAKGVVFIEELSEAPPGRRR